MQEAGHVLNSFRNSILVEHSTGRQPKRQCVLHSHLIPFGSWPGTCYCTLVRASDTASQFVDGGLAVKQLDLSCQHCFRD